MQYVLYDAAERRIRLFDEINYIQNYIDLERLRHGDNIEAKTEILGDISDVEVPPLLFSPFIENCFKHGMKDNDHVDITISFENMNDKFIIFRVRNSYSNSSKEASKHGGIGLKNVLRRLELLYKNDFVFETQETDKEYTVELKIPI